MLEPIHKSITVKAPADRAFRVFTSGMDTWWPRTHHIGKSPMTRTVVEERVGGRCYTEHTDGSQTDWGQVLVWEPPQRFTFAWQVSPHWQHEPDLAKSSEVELRFTALADGTTRVDLEHRNLERHGADAALARERYDAPNAWSGMLQLFREKAEAN